LVTIFFIFSIRFFCDQIRKLLITTQTYYGAKRRFPVLALFCLLLSVFSCSCLFFPVYACLWLFMASFAFFCTIFPEFAALIQLEINTVLIRVLSIFIFYTFVETALVGYVGYFGRCAFLL